MGTIAKLSTAGNRYPPRKLFSNVFDLFDI